MTMYRLMIGVGLLFIAAAFGAAACDVTEAAELQQNEERGRGWQDREYFGATERELAGGDGPASGEAAAEGPASSGSDSGEGCGPR